MREGVIRVSLLLINMLQHFSQAEGDGMFSDYDLKVMKDEIL